MKAVRIHRPEEIQLTRIGDRAGDLPHPIFLSLAPSELDSSMVFHEFGSDSEPQLAELDFIPHAEAVIHKHDDAEILYVLRGEMHFGNEVLKAGASIYIPGDTFYGFRAGPDGLRLLNFRGRADVSFYPKAKHYRVC